MGRLVYVNKPITHLLSLPFPVTQRIRVIHILDGQPGFFDVPLLSAVGWIYWTSCVGTCIQPKQKGYCIYYRNVCMPYLFSLSPTKFNFSHFNQYLEKNSMSFPGSCYTAPLSPVSLATVVPPQQNSLLGVDSIQTLSGLSG
jgi:hypothetical protein